VHLATALLFKTRFESCRIAVRVAAGPFCRKGLRSAAATCDQMRINFKIMPPEITAPHFVSRYSIPLTVRLAAIWKILSGRKDLRKPPNRSVVKSLFPYSTERRPTTGLLEELPQSGDRRVSGQANTSSDEWCQPNESQ